MKQSLLIFSLFLLCQKAGFSQIIWSGVQDITIPTTFAGIYLDVDDVVGTPSISTSPFSDFDINLFYGGDGILTKDYFQPVSTGTIATSPVRILTFNTLVSSSSEFYGTDPKNSNSHPVDVTGYLGFEFIPEGEASNRYGWMHVTLTNNSTPGTIHDWAWENSGGAILAGDIGVIPEPSTYALFAGMIGLIVCVFKKRINIKNHQKLDV